MAEQENLFWQAYDLLAAKAGGEMTDAELLVVGRAITALDIRVRVDPRLDRMTISEGLLHLAIERGGNAALRK